MILKMLKCAPAQGYIVLAFSFKDLLSSLKNGMLFTAQDVLSCYHECITNVLLLELQSVCQTILYST